MKRRAFLQDCAAGVVTMIVARPRGSHAEAAQGAQAAALEEAFRNPPASARPHTWWHWMNGNVTAEGITRDLEAMARVGVGGVQMFDVGTGIPKGPVATLSPEWVRLVEHAAKEADRLGLSFTMHNCPGWSSSGGPWITPELGMQQLVWTETAVTGGRPIEVVLPRPLTKLDYYRDAFVLAFPSLPDEAPPMGERIRSVTSGGEAVDPRLLTDGDLTSAVELKPAAAGEAPALVIEFTGPYEARAIVAHALGLAARVRFGPPHRLTLEASDDGVAFRKVADLTPLAVGPGPSGPTTASFDATRARFFRLVGPGGTRVAQVQLPAAARIPDWDVKANFARRADQGEAPAEVPAGSVIDPDSVVDLTPHMDGQGRLRWAAPPGDWTVLRFGHTPTGALNVAASDRGRGLECDKFSRAALDFHFEKYFGQVLEALAPLAAKGLAGALVDSYETGMQNWSADFPREFARRRGYDLRRYMPAMTGRFVGSAEVTERFLWDLRRSQADLMADDYFGRFHELCRRHGLTSYTEPYGNGPFDEMQAGSRLDVNMGEFWIRGGAAAYTVKLAASVAHVYAKPVVGAESFTGRPLQSRWLEHPFAMKALGDEMYTLGLNNFIFHRYAQQPHPDAAPGMTMGPWGFHFERTNTWWSQGRPWLEYVARCQSLLRRGRFVADLVYFTGENAPVQAPLHVQEEVAATLSGRRARLVQLPPPGHDYDVADAEAILTRMKVEDGRIALPDGMSYRALVLPDDPRMTRELIVRLRDLVEQGMWLVGRRPERSHGLGSHPESDAAVRRVAGELWGDLDGSTRTSRAFGKGRVFWGESLRSILDTLDVQPDFEFAARSPDPSVRWIHRRDGDAEIYFVTNRQRRPEELVCTFRVAGKQPELWDPATGETAAVPVYEPLGGRTRVPVRLDPSGSVFVVFRSPARARGPRSVARDGVTLVTTEPFPPGPAASHRGVTNNFTVSVWVKPETELWPIGPDAAANVGASEYALVKDTLGSYGASFVIDPPEGDALYGEGHATSALSAGRNGVIVYERSRGHFPAVLAAPMPLSGWTHLAVVYRDGEPSLYVDGAFVRKGPRSSRRVRPGVGAPSERPVRCFEGDTTPPEVLPEALGEDRVRQLAASGVPDPEGPPGLEVLPGATPGLLIWQNGRYTLRDAAGRRSIVDVSGLDGPIEVAGPWRVQFPPNLGAPPEATLAKLASLHRHPDPGVRYFSGTATYRSRFAAPAGATSGGRRLYLDLGRVEVIAEVRLNGRSLGVLWKPPHRMDVTEAVRRGENELEVLVTNLWPNRLIGDEQLPPEYAYVDPDPSVPTPGPVPGSMKEVPQWFVEGKPRPPGRRVAFTTWKHYTKDSPLLASGLLGPVRLWSALPRPIEG